MVTSAVKRQFAANLQTAIDESPHKGIPYDKLGKLFGGVSGTMIHEYLTGEKMPSIARAAIIAVNLGVHLEWLLTNRGPMRIKEGISYQGASLLSAFEGMTDEARQEILAHAAFVADKYGDKLTSQELTSLARGFDQDTTRPN